MCDTHFEVMCAEHRRLFHIFFSIPLIIISGMEKKVMKQAPVVLSEKKQPRNPCIILVLLVTVLYTYCMYI